MASTSARTATSHQPARRLVAAGLAGALAVVALSAPGASAVAWIALVPLCAALEEADSRGTLVIAIVYALVLGVGGLAPWLARAAGSYFALGRATALAYTLVFLLVIFSIHGTLLGVLLLGRPRRVGAWQVVWLGAAWACWDVGRTAVFPHFPGGVLAESQHASLAVIQVASLGGVAAITFVLVAANAAFAGLTARTAPPRMRAAATLTGLGIVVVAVGFGAWRLAGEAGESGSGPSVVAVDVDAATPAAGTLEAYLVASERAAATRPALLVWPENALLTDPEHDRAAWSALSAFVAAHGTPLLAGGPGSARLAGRGVVYFNAAHLLAPGEGLRSYHKRGLVPFAERWPPAWPRILGMPAADLTALEPGAEATIFHIGGVPFGVLICFEITDARAARDLAAHGARFIVNLTNDAWFADAPHLPWAAIRAVETGLPVVRVANAGLSAVFDRLGRPLATSRPTGAPAILAASLPAARPTAYASAGDLFLAACAAVVVAGLLHAAALRVRSPGAPPPGP